ncbi:MAG: SPFH domain-containing protein [Clostridia bacterium]|nr:SPFH domain-containing protein [Clostridia bacterium]
MGLIQAGLGAVGGVLADQWKEFFYCEAMPKNILVTKGQKRIGGRSSNTKGSDNIISKGSVIAVADGQCMIIVEQGKIVEVCAEPGEFIYDSSTEPSIFAGSLGQSIKDTFKLIGRRFTFGGDTGKDQRVYYFNLREIGDNKYGTANPIPFRVVIDEALGFKLSVDLRCNGVFSYKITNPLLFYTNVCGNVTEDYDRAEIDGMLKGELLNALQPALAQIAAKKIYYSEIPAHTNEIRDNLNEVLSSEWREKRGIEVFSFAVNSLSIPEDQRKKLTEWEENAMTTNPNVAGARIVGAQSDAMRGAANNPNGAMGGFIGMGMAMNAGGNAQNFYAMGAQQQAQQQAQQPAPQAAPAVGGWVCPQCGANASGNFCTECGAKKPAPAEGWKCPACGAMNKGKFCSECGAKKPAGEPLYRCDKCGWEPKDPKNPPKFCPECGDIFDDKDKQ